MTHSPMTRRWSYPFGLLLLLACARFAHAEVVPFDFTGHWSGAGVVKGATFPLFADFSGTQTFTGTLGAVTTHFASCTVQGVQKKKVKLLLVCDDGSKGKAKGKLDPTTRTIAGKYQSHRPGHGGGHGTFTLTSAGACVPMGGDCTDPMTNGGESAVCCNGDCSQTPTGHTCN